MTRYGVDPPARPVSLMLTPFCHESIGASLRVGSGSGIASATWPTTKLALYVPITLPRNTAFRAIRAFVVTGAAASGNFDLGVYDENWNRLFSTGSTAHSGTAAPQLVTVDWTLTAGRYYLACAFDNTTAAVAGVSGFTAGTLASLGVAQQVLTDLPLPATATPAVCTQTYLPDFGISRIALV